MIRKPQRRQRIHPLTHRPIRRLMPRHLRPQRLHRHRRPRLLLPLTRLRLLLPRPHPLRHHLRPLLPLTRLLLLLPLLLRLVARPHRLPQRKLFLLQVMPNMTPSCAALKSA